MRNLPQLLSNNRVLMWHSAENHRNLLTLIAHVAVEQPVCVFDMGNCFDAFAIARHIRRQTVHVDATLEQIAVARVFTCYETAALLKARPSGPTPIFILKLLTTFYDESLPTAEAVQVLRRCIGEIQRLNRVGPVVTSITPPSAQLRDRQGLIPMLDREIGPLRVEPSEPQMQQLTLI